MIWVLILGLAALAFGAMVLALRLPRSGWEVTGAALLLGLAGYAVQGHPGLPGAPTPPAETLQLADAALIKERQQMGEAFGKGQAWLIMADALTRQGQFRAAADLLGKAARANPDDADIQVALGNALVGHSEGLITPAAQFAFRRAAAIAPDHPGPPFFMGLALAQSGRLVAARAMWADLLRKAPADAPYRADLALRLQRLDQLIAASGQAPPTSGEQAKVPGSAESEPAVPASNAASAK